MFQDIQPAGLSVYGERGVEGKDGVRGSTVYFINYSTISDDLKSTLLTRINESTDLNGSGDTRIYYNNRAEKSIKSDKFILIICLPNAK